MVLALNTRMGVITMPSQYYNVHVEELIEQCEIYEKDPREHIQVRAKRIRALLEREKAKNG